MNKKFFSVLLVAALTASFAQAQFTFGARAGFNLTTSSGKVDGKKVEGDMKPKYKPGFQIGVVGEYAFSDNFAIQPGILFATQGHKVNWSQTFPMGKMEIKGTVNINYLQVPVNAQYKLDLGGNALLLQAGPYFGFALSGKSKSETTFNGETEKTDFDIEFGSKEDQTSPLDFGLGLGVGLQLNAIQIGLGYKLGLANLSNFDDASINNRGFALTATYFFGK